jgi:hypothetical protein
LRTGRAGKNRANVRQRRGGGAQRGICSRIVDDQGSVLKALPSEGFRCLHFRAFFSRALQVNLIGKQFVRDRQEDAHEFMIHLMDAMQVSGTGVSNLAVVMIVGAMLIAAEDFMSKSRFEIVCQASCLRVAGVAASSGLASTTMIHSMFRCRLVIAIVMLC